MRSRYTAYTLGETNYLRSTWHASTCPKNLTTADNARWLGLKIIRTEEGRLDDTEGTVEFVARYKIDGKATRVHEISRFKKENGQWCYVDGKVERK